MYVCVSENSEDPYKNVYFYYEDPYSSIYFIEFNLLNQDQKLSNTVYLFRLFCRVLEEEVNFE